MASYTSNLSSNSNYDVTLNVNQTSQNIGANTSNISWSLVVRKKSGSGYWANDSNASTFSVKIDGTTVSSGQKSYNFTSSTPQSITVASGTRTITHGADGSKSIACSASWKDNKNGLGTGSPSGTLALTTIPRATQPTVSSTTVALGSSITINLPRASSSFTHRIYYNFFSATGLTGGIGNYTNATTSTTFTPPAGLASSYMKNTTSNGAVIYVETRNGSTVIGTKSIAVSITVPNNSTYNPTLTAPTFSEQNSTISSGVSGIWVQGHSKIRVASTASLKYSATASSVRVYIGGAWRPAKISGSTVTISSDYVPTTSGTHSVTVELTDSRGRKATSSGSLSVTAYSKPRLTVSAERNSSESKYITVTAKLDITTLSTKNFGTMELYIRQKGATSWGTAVKTEGSANATINWGTQNFGNYSDILSYEVLVQAKDKLTGFSTFFSSISTATVLMDAYKDVGVSFGKMYEPAKGGSVQIGGDILVDGTSHLGELGHTRLPANTNMNNITTPGFYYSPSNAEVATMTNVPITSAFSLQVYRHAGVVQILTNYHNTDPSVYIRNLYDGKWGSWEGIGALHHSNTNGTSVRFNNGVQICYHQQNTSSGANVATGQMFRTSSTLWTYPVAFTSSPVVVANPLGGAAESWAGLGGSGSGPTNCSFMVWSSWNRGTTLINVGLMAIGMWR